MIHSYLHQGEGQEHADARVCYSHTANTRVCTKIKMSICTIYVYMDHKSSDALRGSRGVYAHACVSMYACIYVCMYA